ncbi:MAG: peptidoglycan-binding protein [Dehalococcoidia bacterium]
MRRGQTALIALGGVVAAAAAGWVAGQQVQSPADAASRARPPEPSPITVPVERKTLVTTVVTRGTARASGRQDVTLAAGARGAGLVTVQPARGQELNDGSVAMEVDGTPVFVLQGTRPMYRDLGPGATGEDVRQLEEALSRLGFNPGRIDGTYDGATEAAVRRWYGAAGYAAPEPAAAEKEALRQAQAAVETARVRVQEAERALASANTPPKAADVLAAEGAVADARDGLAAAERAAARDLRTARTALDAAKETLASTPRTNTGDIRRRTQAVRDAEVALAETEADGMAATRRAAAVITLAESRLSALRQPPDLSKEQSAIADAQAAVERATAELTRLDLTIGTRVRAENVVFVPSLPAVVEEASIVRGAAATGKVMTLSGANLTVDASVTTADARLVKVGQAAELGLPDGKTTAPATIAEIADRPGTNGLDGQHVYVRLTPDAPAAGLKDAPLRVTFRVGSTDGDVLAVPLAALSTRANGESVVDRVAPDGTRALVTVRPGLIADGLVEVTPVGGELSAGDFVVVGEART